MKRIAIALLIVAACLLAATIGADEPMSNPQTSNQIVNSEADAASGADQRADICGDVNYDQFFVPNIMDLVYMLNWMFKGGAAPPSMWTADLDGYQLCNMHDFFYLVDFLFLSFTPPTCPTTQGPMHIVATPTENIYLHTFESFFPYASILEPGQTTFTVHLHFTTDKEIDVASFPLKIRVGTDIPEIQAVGINADCPPGTYDCTWESIVDETRGVVYIGMYTLHTQYSITPGTHALVDLELTVPPLVDVWRPIVITLDSMPPSQDGYYVHQPWAVTKVGADEVWMPEVRTYPCVGMRGNVNADLADGVDISDLTYLVNYLFVAGPPPKSSEETDVTASLTIDISDLTKLVNHLFVTFEALEPCPEEGKS